MYGCPFVCVICTLVRSFALFLFLASFFSALVSLSLSRVLVLSLPLSRLLIFVFGPVSLSLSLSPPRLG